MTPNTRDLSRWQVAGQPFSLECTQEVIEQLRRWTLTADLFPLDRGILWGRRDGHAVTVLSVSRQARAEMPSQSAARTIPVGWFQIRLGADIHLTVDDLLYHDEHFGEPGGTGMILRPAAAGGVRVGVFFRELNGHMRSASSYQEVFLAGPVETLLPSVQTVAPAKAKIERAPVFKSRWAGLSVAFVAGALAGAVSFGAVRHAAVSPPLEMRASAPAPAPIPAPTRAPGPSANGADFEEAKRALAEQNQQLRNDLETVQVHNRRLEATLRILRDRVGTKAASIANVAVKRK